MEKDQLVQLLQHYSGSSEKEAKEVVALRDEFPYCQVFQVLAARTSKDHGWSNQQSLLQMAAVASTDRAVLKEIMVALYTPVTEIVKAVKESATEAVTPVKESAGEKAKPVKEVTGIETVTHTKDLADTVIKDLERLKVLKHNFESLFMDTGNKPLVKSAPVVSTTRPTALEKPVQTEQPGGEKSQKSKKERIIELAKGLEPPVEPEPAKPVEGKAVHGKNSGGDPLIQEIKSTKKKIKPESEKTKEQIEIINQFIKSKPVMAPPKILSGENTENDLSSSIKSGEFGDNIVSETLVEILLRQGKKDKAIEVLKKLIWKFPQKKAYFAAQIDELKK